ncbi:hypothetical protein I551_5899 [Mycobacterium ulcerans str. Harvey]|uniref:Uncharacterized protein n=1 Tax=Mycobacterium ulcerans str. Harvey TaxID=1299332 RepID=A0ABN0QSH7_MYCUL|nr:hypothetical protein I551_5899 [Mycobacterium ulcerans str. Harvey]
MIAALGRSGVGDADLLASFRGVLGLVMGSAQAELAGPLPEPDGKGAGGRRGADRRSGGAEHPHIAALAQASQRSTPAADFERALDILLAASNHSNAVATGARL